MRSPAQVLCCKRATVLPHWHQHLLHIADQSHHTQGTPAFALWQFSYKEYYGFIREDFVFTPLPGVERFLLSQDNVWYGHLKFLFTLSVHIDGQA